MSTYLGGLEAATKSSRRMTSNPYREGLRLSVRDITGKDSDPGQRIRNGRSQSKDLNRKTGEATDR